MIYSLFAVRMHCKSNEILEMKKQLTVCVFRTHEQICHIFSEQQPKNNLVETVCTPSLHR